MSPTGDTSDRAYPWHCWVLTWGQRHLTGKNKTKRVISLMLVRTMKLRKIRNRSESSFLSLLIKCNSSKRKSPLCLEMEHPNSVSRCLWPALISSAWQNIQGVLLGNTDFFLTFHIFFFHFSIKNAQLVLCLSVLFAFLCSSWIFQSYRISRVYTVSWLGSLPPRREQESAAELSDQHSHGQHVSCNACVSSGFLCPFSALQTTPHCARALEVQEWQLSMPGGKSHNEKCRDPHPSQPPVCFWV